MEQHGSRQDLSWQQRERKKQQRQQQQGAQPGARLPAAAPQQQWGEVLPEERQDSRKGLRAQRRAQRARARGDPVALMEAISGAASLEGLLLVTAEAAEQLNAKHWVATAHKLAKLAGSSHSDVGSSTWQHARAVLAALSPRLQAACRDFSLREASTLLWAHARLAVALEEQLAEAVQQQLMRVGGSAAWLQLQLSAE
jgi:hypothetical protein